MFSWVLSVGLMVSSGGLLSERVPAAGMLVGAVDVTSASYDNLSISELTTERTRLSVEMPSPALGIALISVGGGVLLVGLLMLAAYEFEVELLVGGLVLTGLAIPLLIIGPILLVAALRERREAKTQMALIDQHIAELNREDYGRQQPQSPMVPVNDEVPPPPPVRPPGSQFAPNVVPQLLLASF